MNFIDLYGNICSFIKNLGSIWQKSIILSSEQAAANAAAKKVFNLIFLKRKYSTNIRWIGQLVRRKEKKAKMRTVGGGSLSALWSVASEVNILNDGTLLKKFKCNQTASSVLRILCLQKGE